jgi:hypothetical protein
MDPSEGVTQNIGKVLAAFIIGLVTVFGGALIFSNLQQSSEPMQAVQRTRSEQPTASVEPSRSKAVLAQSLPENPTQVEDTVVLPEPPKQNTTVLVRPAGNRLRASGRSTTENSPLVASPVSSNNLPQFGSNSDVPPKLPLPAPIQENRVEQSQRSAAEPVFQVPASQVVVVPASTTIEVRLLDTLSSDSNRSGDTFRAMLASPLTVNGYLLAEAGAAVLGRVETSRRAPLIGGQSELSVALTEISTLDGQKVRVETGWRKVKGVRSTLTNTARMATGALSAQWSDLSLVRQREQG